MDQTQLTALIVDDHALVRTGLRRLVQDHPSIATVIEAGTGEEALEMVNASVPDVIVMDLSLPGISGVETILQLLDQNPAVRIIVLTGSTDEADIQRLLLAGLLGYLTKGCSADEMGRAISDVLAGRQYLSSDVAQRVALNALGNSPCQPLGERTDDDAPSPFDVLSSRELEIAMLLLDGKRNRQISDALFISEKTVSTHRTRAFGKLGIQSTVELARLAITHGLDTEPVRS